MKLYSQVDPLWENDKLGTCGGETIGKSGCKITCYGMLCEKTPAEVNKKITYTSGCLTVDSVNSKELGLIYRGVVYKKPEVTCIAETDHYKSKGVPQHFFVIRKDGMIVDPLDYPCYWKSNKYNVVSYRLIYPISEDETTMLTPKHEKNYKKIAQAVAKKVDYNYGDNPNDEETEKILKRLDSMPVEIDKIVEKIVVDETKVNQLKSEIDFFEEKTKNQTDMLKAKDGQIEFLKKAEVGETINQFDLGNWRIIIKNIKKL